jgi:hypothetical protein
VPVDERVGLAFSGIDTVPARGDLSGFALNLPTLAGEERHFYGSFVLPDAMHERGLMSCCAEWMQVGAPG